MSARTTAVRRALYTLADALADFLEAETVRPAEAPTEPANDAPEPNPEMAEAFARREVKRNGWPTPKGARRS